ncbi:MAG: hypothetical protein RL015_1341 [Verrucomicrobiota bacterium]
MVMEVLGQGAGRWTKNQTALIGGLGSAQNSPEFFSRISRMVARMISASARHSGFITRHAIKTAEKTAQVGVAFIRIHLWSGPINGQVTECHSGCLAGGTDF